MNALYGTSAIWLKPNATIEWLFYLCLYIAAEALFNIPFNVVRTALLNKNRRHEETNRILFLKYLNNTKQSYKIKTQYLNIIRQQRLTIQHSIVNLIFDVTRTNVLFYKYILSDWHVRWKWDIYLQKKIFFTSLRNVFDTSKLV